MEEYEPQLRDLRNKQDFHVSGILGCYSLKINRLNNSRNKIIISSKSQFHLQLEFLLAQSHIFVVD